MEKYIKLTVSFVKRQYYPHLLLLFLFVALSGGFVSFRGLESQQAAKVMEMYAAFTGILLFTPLLCRNRIEKYGILKEVKEHQCGKIIFCVLFWRL